ncbi:MAG: DUF4838 domain-containing protein [Clostridia bacterium]|nr:DUF4838 domain-containing protein [Clostridia bacterium]
MRYMLAKNGSSQWRIIMPHPTHETVKLAAHELHHFLMEVCGASLPTQTDMQPYAEMELLVGRSTRLEHYGIEVDWESLGEEEYVFKTGEHYILLAGATPRATLYAVYAFLEEVIGIRWFASDCTSIPKTACLEIEVSDRQEGPAFESREAYWSDAFDGKYAVRNRMNSNKADISIRQGGRMKFHMFHHSFDELLPAKEYFAEHPEYYALVDGKRLGTKTQLCLTNPDVVRLSIQKVKQWIRENPDCRVFSVAQNDRRNFCTCPACAALDEREESHAGTMIAFVNQIAEAIEGEHPDVLIHTFAYQYTRKAPKTIKPRKNVIVRLCSIECCFSHPLDGGLLEPLHQDSNIEIGRAKQCAARKETAFLEDLKDWSKICQHLYVWDYVTMFSEYLMPFPNFDVLAKNLQLFKKIGVAGVLEQGNFSQGGGGHLAELQAYLQAKLMWNPDCDMERHMNEFLHGYYGADAAPHIREYIELWQRAARPWHVGIFERPNAKWVTDETIEKAMEILGTASWLTKNPEQKARIEKLILGMDYLIIARMPVNTPGRNALIARFGWKQRMLGITEIHERWPLEAALDWLKTHELDEKRERLLTSDYKM